ncbi:MAG: hypothetical protein HYU29_06380 [Chloroflexi bacterium]|nr:hypothetical protein [Chloroflexota bacterium]
MLTVTHEAQEKLKEVLESRGLAEGMVRVDAVRGPHGCVHGWKLALEETTGPEDVVISAGPMRMLAEPELVELLDGASVDYREDATGIGFVIEVPGAGLETHQCQCGHHH